MLPRLEEVSPEEYKETLPPAEISEFGSHLGQISRQSSVFLAGTIFTVGFGYLFKVYVARMLGAEALGIYALGMTATGLASVIAAVGLPQSAQRFVAAYSAKNERGKLRGFIWRSLGVLVLSHALAGSFLIVFKGFIGERLYHAPGVAQNMSLFVSLMFLGAFTSFFGEVLAGFKEVALRTVITSFVGTPLLMLSVIALLTLGLGLRGYLAGQLISTSVVLLMLFAAVWKLSPRAAVSAIQSLPPLEPEAIGYAKTLLFVQALEFSLTQTGRIALGMFVTVRSVGIYSLAVGLTSFVPIALQSVNQIFSPTIAELQARGDRALLLRLYQTLTKWTLGVTIPLAFSVMIFARPLMALFGPDFGVGWPVLSIISAGELINCGVGSVGMLLFMSGQESRVLRIQTFLSPLLVILNFATIHVWGVIGAAMVAAFTNAITNLLYLRTARKTLGIFPSTRGYSHLVTPSLVTLCITLGLRFATNGFHLQLVVIAVSLILGYCSFFLTVAMGETTPDDKAILRDAWAFIQQSTAGRALTRQFSKTFAGSSR
jgi:O-antigen/teichoic acid export membrane protein